MINQEDERKRAFAQGELSVDMEAVDRMVFDYCKKIERLEKICAGLVVLPKGVESHEWSDYKMETSK